MADFWEKLWHGLRGELLRTILLAVIVSILLYTGLQPVSRVVLQSFYTNSDFLQTKTDAVGTLIQQNVAESGISSRQVRRITDWYSRGDQPGGCILRVEKDGVVIYDSALNNVEYYRTYSQASKTLDESAYLRTYPLEFSDGSATLYAYGYFDFAVDEAVRTAEFWLCLVLGIGIVLWAVWKKLNYMETLEQSIRVLEGGQLDYKVPVRGTDELAQMAQSLNEMSASLKQQMEQVQQAQQQRYELVTSLSHDLRTPLTAQLGYLELLAEHRYQTPQQHDDYLNKCVRSCQSVIELSNGLFRIASGEAPRRELRLEALDAPEVFLQVFAEKLSLLEEQGWQVQYPEADCPACTLQLDVDALCRIADNLVSNLQKYADPAQPVRFGITREGDSLCVRLSNAVRATPQGDSHGVGLKNVEAMMAQMHGRVRRREIGGRLCLTLDFPLCPIAAKNSPEVCFGHASGEFFCFLSHQRAGLLSTSGMMLSGAAARHCGAAGAAASRFALLTFHHRRVVPSGAAKITFQSKGFSLVERRCTGRAFGAPGAQGAKSWARMPTAVQPSGTRAARCSGAFHPVSCTVCSSTRVQGRMFLHPVSRAAVVLCGSANTALVAPARSTRPPSITIISGHRR